MKRIFTLILILTAAVSHAQLLSWTPDFIKESSASVTITADANYGNQGLLSYTGTAYVHIGVITNLSTSSSNWLYVKTSWTVNNSANQATALPNHKYSFSISATNLRTYFGITNSAEKILKIAILFRSADGNSKLANTDGSDMFVSVYDDGLYARIDNPFKQPLYTPAIVPINKSLGDNLPVVVKASQSSTITTYFNGVLLNTKSAATKDSVNAAITTAGNQQVVVHANNGTTTAVDTINFVVAPASNIAPLPPGVTDGINYGSDNTSATLVLYAPAKKNIFVLGDFNSWTPSVNYLMNVTPDGKRFWITLTGLTSGTEYAYQYLIDGTIKVADYNAEKILDPNNDQYIPSTTYPNLKAYPTGKTTGIVSVLQTGKPAYNWQVTNFARPDKRNLIVYELLVRDFVAAGNWQTLKDTLGYLKKLGINAIEVMPFNEFEGNNSWGYNPDFYFAPDKAYGTETALKQFIDACHQQGFAVIMDMVLNHSFGSSPMVQMYFDNVNNIPTADNPWFEQYYTHAYDVGYQFKNSSDDTKDFRKRVIAYWLNNYHIDGYRFDLAKGFTPTNTCDATGNNCNVTTWGNYDQARVNIWDTLYKYQQSVSANSYTILEMFADNSEETVYSNSGMMVWGNLNYNYNQATMGYSTDWDFGWGIYSARSWTKATLVTYQESHDEERLMYKNEQYGNSSGAYNVKTVATGLSRNAMATAFWSMVPGPKMLWQFGELGYDYSINTCADFTTNSNCRTDAKPIKWNYLQDANRKSLHDVYAALFRMRALPAYAGTFTEGAVTYNLAGSVKWMDVTGSNLKIAVIGNFDVVQKTASVTFPATGQWYSYLTDSVAIVASTTFNVTLKPGEYYVFTNVNLRSTALPVNWVSFTATAQNNKTVLLNWSTATEINNDHYVVERSADGKLFNAIGTVSAGSAPTSLQQYNFTDAMPINGTSFYRLQQVDKDGSFSYSTIQTVRINNVSADKWIVYPNPVNSATALFAQAYINTLQLTLTDASGKVLYSNYYNNVTNGQRIDIPVQGLAKGLYLLKVTTDKSVKTDKLIIQ
jgi:1,4-alpha-glucan branching enzyme